jgi:hypothetical protein
MSLAPEDALTRRQRFASDGDRSVDSAGPELWDRVAGRALEFQDYLLRRAWGVYYAIWAAGLATFFSYPAWISFVFPSLSAAEALLFYAPILLLIVLAVWATTWSIGQTFRVSRFRSALRREARPHRHFSTALVIGLAIFVVVVAVAYVSSFASLLVLDACLAAINLWNLLRVRDAFSRPPPESAIAIGTYAVSAVGSAVALLLTHSQSWFGAFWAVAVVGWSFCAVYALYHAPEELALASGG